MVYDPVAQALDQAYGRSGVDASESALDRAYGPPLTPAQKFKRRRIEIERSRDQAQADADAISAQAWKELAAQGAGTIASMLVPGGAEIKGAQAGLQLAKTLAIRGGLGALGGAAGGGVEAKVAGEDVLPAAIRGGALGLVGGTGFGLLSNRLAKPTAQLATQAGEAIAEAKPSTAVDRVVEALKSAPKLEKTQEQLRTIERVKRIKGSEQAAAGLKGEAAVRAIRGAHKGELPKVDFEALRGKISDQDVTDLIEQVRNHPALGWYERNLNGPKALIKVFDGELPTKSETELLDTVFGQKLTKALLDKRPTLQKAADLGIQIANIPREMMSSFDMSAPFRQGAFLIGKPKQFGDAFVSMFKTVGSQRAMTALNEQIASRPTFGLMRDAGLALTQVGTGLVGKREEAFAGSLLSKVPLVGPARDASERAYVGFLNKLRADTFDDLIRQAQNEGHAPATVAKDVARFVNAATGRGDVPKAIEASMVPLSTVFFSPRLIASRAQLLNPLFYAKLHPVVRKEAIKSLMVSGATAASLLGLAKLGGAEVTADPTSNDFGKIKLGNTRFDMMAGFGQYVRLGARLATQDGRVGEIGRFFRYKEAPLFALAHDLMAGNTALGQEITLPATAKRMLLPLVMQDLKDALDEWGPLGAASLIPSAFGVSVQTYE